MMRLVRLKLAPHLGLCHNPRQAAAAGKDRAATGRGIWSPESVSCLRNIQSDGWGCALFMWRCECLLLKISV